MQATPLIDTEALAALTRLVASGNRPFDVFEWGAGGSTLWFGQQGARVWTTEHDKNWHDRVCAAQSALPIVLLYRPLVPPDYTAYTESINETQRDYDLVFVDGRQRVLCFKQGIERVKPNGYILLHDSERSYYAACRQMALAKNFEITEIVEARSMLVCRNSARAA